MILIYAAIEDGDTDARTHGRIPWAVGGTAGDACAKASGLQDSPLLRRCGVVGVVGSVRCRSGGGSRGGCGRRGANGDSDGGGKNGAEDEGVGGEDAVMDDVLNGGIGA